MPIWLWRMLWPLRARFSPGTEVGGCFPDFTMKDLQGRPHSLYDSAPGIRTVLWLTNFCEDCRGKIPLLEDMRREAGDRFRILAVSILTIDDPLPKETAPKCGFPILLDPEDIVSLRLGQAHPAGACPMRNLYILNGTGKILFKHHLSALRPEAFRAAWTEALKSA